MKYEQIVKELNQIKELCEEDSPIIASKRLEWLINDIEEYRNKVSFWNILTNRT